MTSSRRVLAQAGFTRTDLITSLAVVTMLATLAMVSLAVAGGRSGSMLCQHNLGRLAQAWLLFAEDNRGSLVPSIGTANDPAWVTDILSDGAGNTSNTNVVGLTQSRLWKYLEPRSTSVFRCPDDPTVVAFGSVFYPRVRSYSLNAWMNGTAWTSGFKTATNLAALSNPARTSLFLDEHEASINDGAFIIDMRGYSPYSPSTFTLVDLPSARHLGGACLSFGDGHAEWWKWSDARTVPTYIPGKILSLNTPQPNNLDVYRLQGVAGALR